MHAGACGGEQVPQSIVVLWHSGSIADLARNMQRFMPRGTTVTVVAKEEPQVLPAAPLLPALPRPAPLPASSHVPEVEALQGLFGSCPPVTLMRLSYVCCTP